MAAPTDEELFKAEDPLEFLLKYLNAKRERETVDRYLNPQKPIILQYKNHLGGVNLWKET